jgi:hypothetical protein
MDDHFGSWTTVAGSQHLQPISQTSERLRTVSHPRPHWSALHTKASSGHYPTQRRPTLCKHSIGHEMRWNDTYLVYFHSPIFMRSHQSLRAFNYTNRSGDWLWRLLIISPAKNLTGPQTAVNCNLSQVTVWTSLGCELSRVVYRTEHI